MSLLHWRETRPDKDTMPERRFLRSRQERLLLWLFSGDLCQICHLPLGRTFDADHIRRYADGGQTCLPNMRATHPECNQKRGSNTSG